MSQTQTIPSAPSGSINQPMPLDVKNGNGWTLKSLLDLAPQHLMAHDGWTPEKILEVCETAWFFDMALFQAARELAQTRLWAVAKP